MGFLTVFGHTNIDYLAAVDRLPGPDESMAFEGPVRALGGTAANIAVVAATLGAPVALASFVGPDFPEAFRTFLRRRRVDLRHLVVVPGATTPVCWIFTDPDERQVAFINQGAALQGAEWPVDRRSVEGSEVVHFATGPPAFHLRAGALAAGLGRHVAFDPGQELAYVWTPALFKRMLKLSDTLFLNDSERRTALRYLRLRKDRDLLNHVDALVLTHGRRGSEFLGARERLTQPAVPAKRLVNTTGAGDAFRGGLYAARWRGLDNADQLRWGAAAASFVVETASGPEAAPSVARLRSRLNKRPAGLRIPRAVQ